MLNKMPKYNKFKFYLKNGNQIRVICSDHITDESVKTKNILNQVYSYAEKLSKSVSVDFLDFSKVKETYEFCLKNFKKQPLTMTYFYDIALNNNCTRNKYFLELYIKLHFLDNYETLIKEITSQFSIFSRNKNLTSLDYDNFFNHIINQLKYNHSYLDIYYDRYFKEGVESNNKYFYDYINNLFDLNPVYIKQIKDNSIEIIRNFLIDYGCILSLDYRSKLNYLKSIQDYLLEDDELVLLQAHILDIPLIIYQIQQLYNHIKLKKNKNDITTNLDIEKVVQQYNFFQKYIDSIPYLYDYKAYSIDVSYKVKEIKEIDDWNYDYSYFSGFEVKEVKHYNDMMIYAFKKLILINSKKTNPFLQIKECERCHTTENEAKELKDKRKRYCNKCATIVKKEKAKERQRKHRDKITNLQ